MTSAVVFLIERVGRKVLYSVMMPPVPLNRAGKISTLLPDSLGPLGTWGLCVLALNVSLLCGNKPQATSKQQDLPKNIYEWPVSM